MFCYRVIATVKRSIGTCLRAIGRSRWTAGLMLVAVSWSSLQAADPTDRQWRFTVLLDGKPIGHHHVDLIGRGTEIEYRSETRLNVKILFLTVFRYLHVDREIWRDGCLTKIESTTDDNGKAQSLHGSGDQQGFVVRADLGEAELTSNCVMTFAYWNPRILSASRLMNAQTGEYLPVRIDALGVEEIEVRGTRVTALHYSIVAEKLNIELWYAADDGNWVALSTTTDRGGRLEYRL